MFGTTDRIANALFTILSEERTKRSGLRYDGVVHSDEPPGWFAVALFFADTLSDSTDWAATTDLIALIQVSMRDCERAIDRESSKGDASNAEWLRLLNEVQDKIYDWLNNRDLVPKEGI